MNIISIKQWLGLVAISVLIFGCAEYDVKEESTASTAKTKTVEVPQATAQQHTKEMASAAISEAREASKRADELGGQWRDTGKLIKTAEASLKKNNADKAYNFATMAKEQADIAINQSYLEIANHKIGQVKEMMSRDDSKMLERVNEAESAYLDDNGEKAYAMSIAMLEDLKAMTNMAKAETTPAVEQAQAAKEEAPPADMMATPSSVTIGESKSQEMQMQDQYKVVSGDSLWGISKKPEIYNNPYQWPLIYKTNRDQINDPDMILPGMVLAIDRAVSEADINAAITHAKHRGAWSLGEVEASDQAYLSGDSIATR